MSKEKIKKKKKKNVFSNLYRFFFITSSKTSEIFIRVSSGKSLNIGTLKMNGTFKTKKNCNDVQRDTGFSAN